MASFPTTQNTTTSSSFFGGFNAHPTDPHRNRFVELRGSLVDVGIFKDTLLPSLGLHSSLALVAYGVGRYTENISTKDHLWSVAPVINAWWSAVGRRVFVKGMPLSQVPSLLSRPERLLLGGVTLWGGRLIYQAFTRRGVGRSDPLKAELEAKRAKNPRAFWNNALWKIYLPEAIVQALISLPFVAPFRHQGGVFTGYHPMMQALAVGLFTAGYALEVLADAQLERSRQKGKAETETMTEGVWSITNSPSALGDSLLHLSFPILLYASDMLAPIELIGPIANYLFLQSYIRPSPFSSTASSDAAEKGAQVTSDKSFTDKVAELVTNQWTWIVVGAGVLGAGVEAAIEAML